MKIFCQLADVFVCEPHTKHVNDEAYLCPTRSPFPFSSYLSRSVSAASSSPLRSGLCSRARQNSPLSHSSIGGHPVLSEAHAALSRVGLGSLRWTRNLAITGDVPAVKVNGIAHRPCVLHTAPNRIRSLLAIARVLDSPRMPEGVPCLAAPAQCNVRRLPGGDLAVGVLSRLGARDAPVSVTASSTPVNLQWSADRCPQPRGVDRHRSRRW
ncbi:hypothetical protein FB387_006742 [Streptomyces cinereoruber]|nr:hypothetical protein [Streptomyces cinereoruber]NIH65507.1 hypothetical protein [Streptomyces cinereoruber]